ncbi:hypothetical protein N7326_08580, partial [Corynebacterium sp. ES2794-CONJ1]|uniref:hypothetical protein n=1 Tax=unclassified Corynebacterium TaxID=2624378 RepID=UPI00216B5BB2
MASLNTPKKILAALLGPVLAAGVTAVPVHADSVSSSLEIPLRCQMKADATGRNLNSGLSGNYSSSIISSATVDIEAPETARVGVPFEYKYTVKDLAVTKEYKFAGSFWTTKFDLIPTEISRASINIHNPSDTSASAVVAQNADDISATVTPTAVRVAAYVANENNSVDGLTSAPLRGTRNSDGALQLDFPETTVTYTAAEAGDATPSLQPSSASYDNAFFTAMLSADVKNGGADAVPINFLLWCTPGSGAPALPSVSIQAAATPEKITLEAPESVVTDDPFTVNGQLFDAADQAVAGAGVTIRYGTEEQQVRSNDQGEYTAEFTAQGEGAQQIEAVVTDHPTVTEQATITVKAKAAVESVSVTATPDQVESGSPVTLRAEVTYTPGDIVPADNVSFHIGSTKVSATRAGSVYTATWTPPRAGTFDVKTTIGGVESNTVSLVVTGGQTPVVPASVVGSQVESADSSVVTFVVADKDGAPLADQEVVVTVG